MYAVVAKQYNSQTNMDKISEMRDMPRCTSHDCIKIVFLDSSQIFVPEHRVDAPPPQKKKKSVSYFFILRKIDKFRRENNAFNFLFLLFKNKVFFLFFFSTFVFLSERRNPSKAASKQFMRLCQNLNPLRQISLPATTKMIFPH